MGNRAAKRSERHAQSMFTQNANLQREFAKHGIQWRVADAKRSGIHPLAAVGASTHTASPVALGADHSGIARSGQDISRAMQTAFQGKSKQMQLYNAKVRELNIKNMELRNGLLASQIARNQQAGQVPRTGIGGPMLVDGQSDTELAAPPGMVITMPKRRTVSGPRPSEELGAVPDSSWVRTGKGWARVPSKQAKELTEDMWIPSIQWQIRNQIADMYGQKRHPPVKLRKGHYWRYQPMTGNWFQSPRKRPWEHYRR